MALSLEQVITSARDQHPAMHRSRVPNGVLARFLSDYQNQLLAEALKSDPFYVVQTATVALALSSLHGVGTAGPGTEGGVPATLDDSDDVAAVQQTSGALVTLDTSDDAVTVYGPHAATSATPTTLTRTGSGRTVNADTGKSLVIVAGIGVGQVREILSNTSDTWTVAQDWTTLPTTASVFEVVDAVEEVGETQGVVTSLPATVTRQGFLVRLDATGTPFIDYDSPLTATVETGVPLPSMAALLGGTVHYTAGERDPLTITTFRDRFAPPGFPAVYAMGEEVRLCGETADWEDVASLELLYAPIAPAFTALSDYCLVPDAAKPCLVAKAAAFMAMRLAGQADVQINPAAYQAHADAAELRYLQSLRTARRPETRRMRGMDD